MGEMADYYNERDIDEMVDYDLNPGYIETPGGWCIPASQAPEPFTFPGATRGGIKYPTPTKETHMGLTPKQKVRKLEAELDSNLTLQKTLREEEVKLRNDIRRADIPNQPPRDVGDMFRVVVQFTPRGPHYTYLLMRNANRWYTTGVSEEQKRFDSWSALAGWLNSTNWHSDLQLLDEVGKSFPTKHAGEVPF
jgi:hypothetical protein